MFGVSTPTEFTELTEVWGAAGCVGMAGCHTLLHLCASVISVGDPSLQEVSVRSVGSVGYSSPTDCTNQHRWLVALVRPRNPQNSQKFGCVSGCVGTAGCHTLLHLCKSVLSMGAPSLQEASAFRGFCGSTTACLVGAAETAAPPEIASVPSVEVSSQQEISVRSVGSVGGYSMNVAAWAWQDAILSYTMGSEMPCIF